jgi:hypothetical protein
MRIDILGAHSVTVGAQLDDLFSRDKQGERCEWSLIEQTAGQRGFAGIKWEGQWR